jgi:hypothetical protein
MASSSANSNRTASIKVSPKFPPACKQIHNAMEIQICREMNLQMDAFYFAFKVSKFSVLKTVSTFKNQAI